MARRKSRNHKQKMYKMKGCSKSRKNNCRSKKYLGGKNPDLAYPSKNVPTVPNPHLAYTGGRQVYPASGPPPQKGDNFINPPLQRGGTCSMCNGLQRGGSCGSCGACNLKMGMMQNGGACSNNGIPYPNGLAGSAWSINNLPGTSLPGDANHYKFNPQIDNPQTQMVANGASSPFPIGGRRRRGTRRNQKGGNFDNFMYQDLVNLGRQFSYGLGSAYNTIAGYPAPVNPLPWKGQFPNNPQLRVNT
jgi:hypothetical protein